MKISELEPVFVKFMPDELEAGKLYISEEFETSQHICPCGCGITAHIPFWGEDNWKLIKHDDGKVSMTPSLLHRFCKAHYFITENKIIWC